MDLRQAAATPRADEEFGINVRTSVIRRCLLCLALASFQVLVLFPSAICLKIYAFPEIPWPLVFSLTQFGCLTCLFIPHKIGRIIGTSFLLSPTLIMISILTRVEWLCHFALGPFFFCLLGSLRFNAILMISLQTHLETVLAICHLSDSLPYAETSDVVLFFCYVIVLCTLPLAGTAFFYLMRIWNRKILCFFLLWGSLDLLLVFSSFFVEVPYYVYLAIMLNCGLLCTYVCLEFYVNWQRLDAVGLGGAANGLSDRELEELGSMVIYSAYELKYDFCSICQDHIEVGQAITLLPPCNHWFHTQCVHVWLRHKPVCPNCNCTVGRSGSSVESDASYNGITRDEAGRFSDHNTIPAASCERGAETENQESQSGDMGASSPASLNSWTGANGRSRTARISPLEWPVDLHSDKTEGAEISNDVPPATYGRSSSLSFPSNDPVAQIGESNFLLSGNVHGCSTMDGLFHYVASKPPAAPRLPAHRITDFDSRGNSPNDLCVGDRFMQQNTTFRDEVTVYGLPGDMGSWRTSSGCREWENPWNYPAGWTDGRQMGGNASGLDYGRSCERPEDTCEEVSLIRRRREFAAPSDNEPEEEAPGKEEEAKLKHSQSSSSNELKTVDKFANKSNTNSLLHGDSNANNSTQFQVAPYEPSDWHIQIGRRDNFSRNAKEEKEK